MKTLVGGLFTAALLLALGVGAVWAIWDWKNTIEHIAVALIISISFATALWLPVFLFFIVRERAFSTAWTKAKAFWVDLFDNILSQM